MRSLNVVLLLLAPLAAQAAIPATFSHGVASGDPLPTGIVLWTRVTPRQLVTGYTPLHKWPSFNVSWTIYSDAATSRPVQSGTYNATKDHDFTVKIFADGLSPASEYWYNFQLVNGSEVSQTGHFKLPPKAGAPLDSLKYFFFSCSNWPTGYFNAYDFASKYDLDFWMHLGDWLYEYGVSDGSSDIRWQQPPQGLQPAGDIQSIDDYRGRHALYRSDPGLQALSQSAALISIWDDHEFMNNVWRGGAQNQYPGEVEYFQRKHNAVQAYTEWMPIRWNFTATPSINVAADYAINRTFEFGDLATLFMLEDRVTARTQAGQDSNEFDPTEITDPSTAVGLVVANAAPDTWNQSVVDQMNKLNSYYNTKRTNKSDEMLGPAQIAWIKENTQRSAAANVTWQLYAEGTVMQDWFSPDYEGALAQGLAPNNAVHDYWQQVLTNLTADPPANGPNYTITSYSTAARNRNAYGKTSNVTASTREDARTSVALGRYKFNNDFDSWQGYLWDRYYFLDNITDANNPTVYSGDSHDFWTGVLTLIEPEYYVENGTFLEVPTSPVVATEFDGGSVTSDGSCTETTWPLDFNNAAWLAANPNMVHVEGRYKGGIYVQLSHAQQHVENIYVDNIASMQYTGFCGAAFDVPAGEKVVNPGTCTAVPTSPPYMSTGTNIAAQFAVNGLPAIPAGTAMPTDPFLVSSKK